MTVLTVPGIELPIHDLTAKLAGLDDQLAVEPVVSRHVFNDSANRTSSLVRTNNNQWSLRLHSQLSQRTCEMIQFQPFETFAPAGNQRRSLQTDSFIRRPEEFDIANMTISPIGNNDSLALHG